jgi:hypothetical protein
LVIYLAQLLPQWRNFFQLALAERINRDVFVVSDVLKLPLVRYQCDVEVCCQPVLALRCGSTVREEDYPIDCRKLILTGSLLRERNARYWVPQKIWLPLIKFLSKRDILARFDFLLF